MRSTPSSATVALVALAVLLALASAAHTADIRPHGMQGHVDPVTGTVVPPPADAGEPAAAPIEAPRATPTPVPAPAGGVMMRTDGLTFEAKGSLTSEGAAVECDEPPLPPRPGESRLRDHDGE